MPYRNPHDAELQLHTYVHRGQWPQALATIDEWLEQEPWRTELLLRKAQVLRALQRYDEGLAAIRQYRQQERGANIAFLEIEFLLLLNRLPEARHLLFGLPEEQQRLALGEYYHGRLLLAQGDIPAGLQALWTAFQREPGYHRALTEWATIASRHYGRRWVRRRLDGLLTQRKDNAAVAVSVGLALNMVDSRRGERVLRRAVERYAGQPSGGRTMQPADLPATPPRGHGGRDAYRAAYAQLIAGHFRQAIDAYYQAVHDNPSWVTVLAPLMAETLVDDLVRPEEARRLLEEALREDPTNYRLHMSHTKVFLRLGFGEEALSSAGSALALAPDNERAYVLVLRAGAHLLRKDRDRALADLASAVGRKPEVRTLIRAERALRPLFRDRRFRLLMGEHEKSASGSLAKLWRWMVGD